MVKKKALSVYDIVTYTVKCTDKKLDCWAVKGPGIKGDGDVLYCDKESAIDQVKLLNYAMNLAVDITIRRLKKQGINIKLLK